MTAKRKVEINFIYSSGCLKFYAYFKGLSSLLSAKALKALSREVCIDAHARSNSIKLCAHLLAINSRPDLNLT